MYGLYVRHILTSYTNFLGKLHDMGILGTGGGGYVVAYFWNRLETNRNGRRGKLSDIEHKLTVSAFARRRLPVVMTRLRMSDHVQAAVDLIEQGHVRVGTDVVTDPAYLVTR
jgi:U3 small nucleolar ribonucleoprotein protein IMP3